MVPLKMVPRMNSDYFSGNAAPYSRGLRLSFLGLAFLATAAVRHLRQGALDCVTRRGCGRVVDHDQLSRI